jgi:hypothetical protein
MIREYSYWPSRALGFSSGDTLSRENVLASYVDQTPGGGSYLEIMEAITEPRHLKNSAETLMKYEKDNPQTAPLLQEFAKAVLAPKPKSAPVNPSRCPITSAT